MADQKQKQKFEQQWKQILSLTQTQSPEKVVKVADSEVLAIFKEIAEEREKKAREEFKVSLAGILQAKLELDKSITKGREELAKKEEKEYETLNNELAKVLGKLNYAKQQNQQLVSQAGGNFEAPAEEVTTNGNGKEQQ